jgi:hypothetical protein
MMVVVVLVMRVTSASASPAASRSGRTVGF